MEKVYTFSLTRKEMLALLLAMNVAARVLADDPHITDTIGVEKLGFKDGKDFLLTMVSVSEKHEKQLEEQIEQ